MTSEEEKIQSMQDQTRAMLEADPEYAAQEFTFTFRRDEVSSIMASLEVSRRLLGGFAGELCAQVQARIQANETFMNSRRPPRGKLS